MTSPDAYAPLSPAEKLEKDAALAGLAAAETLSGIEIAVVVLIGLLVCPPLAILAFLVVVPTLGAALVVGLLAAVLSAPYLLVHHLRARHRAHGSLFVQRLRHAGRALLDLLPHRLVAGAREGGPVR
jgi:Flp pilus assembly protein TadB